MILRTKESSWHYCAFESLLEMTNGAVWEIIRRLTAKILNAFNKKIINMFSPSDSSDYTNHGDSEGLGRPLQLLLNLGPWLALILFLPFYSFPWVPLANLVSFHSFYTGALGMAEL